MLGVQGDECGPQLRGRPGDRRPTVAVLEREQVPACRIDHLDATTDELGVWDYLGALLVCQESGVAVVDAAGRDLVTFEHTDRRTPVAGATPELREALLALHPVHGTR